MQRVHIPGIPGNRRWCYENRSSPGGHSSSKIIESPKLGQVRLNG